MSLPEQLQKQVDSAQEIIKQHYGPAADDQATGDDAGKPPETPAPATDDVIQPPAGATTQQPGESDESYAQRWRSLQGIYNANQAQLRAALQRTADLERLVSTMSTQGPAQTRQQPAQEAPQFLTDKDSEDYGKDMVDFARRAAKEEMAPIVGAIQQLRQELASLRGSTIPALRNVAANQNRSAEELFFERLTKQVPNWNEINNNGRFHEWLLTPDPMTDITRQTYLEDAQKSLNLARVVSIFQQWMQITGTLADSQQRQTQGRPNTAASELERQVAPGKATAGTVPPQNKQRTWSRSQITKFYSDVTRGVYKGKPEEKDQLERDLFLAQREGRVVDDAA